MVMFNSTTDYNLSKKNAIKNAIQQKKTYIWQISWLGNMLI